MVRASRPSDARGVEIASFSFDGPRTMRSRAEYIVAWMNRTGKRAPESGKAKLSYVLRLALNLGLTQLEKEMER